MPKQKAKLTQNDVRTMISELGLKKQAKAYVKKVEKFERATDIEDGYIFEALY